MKRFALFKKFRSVNESQATLSLMHPFIVSHLSFTCNSLGKRIPDPS